MLLVVLVVWVFLGSARAALIPATAVAASLIGSFGAMYLLGFSLNNLSMMALILGTSLIVDDAVVVVENIKRHVERGTPVYRAAIRGAGEVSLTLVAMNVSLMVIFVSILFMGGVVERLFREFSLSLAAAMLISLFVSLTLTPSLSSRLLPRAKTRKLATTPRPWHGAFDSVRDGYGRALGWALGHRAVGDGAVPRSRRPERLDVRDHPEDRAAAAGHGPAARLHPRRQRVLVPDHAAEDRGLSAPAAEGPGGRGRRRV